MLYVSWTEHETNRVVGHRLAEMPIVGLCSIFGRHLEEILEVLVREDAGDGLLVYGPGTQFWNPDQATEPAPTLAAPPAVAPPWTELDIERAIGFRLKGLTAAAASAQLGRTPFELAWLYRGEYGTGHRPAESLPPPEDATFPGALSLRATPAPGAPTSRKGKPWAQLESEMAACYFLAGFPADVIAAKIGCDPGEVVKFSGRVSSTNEASLLPEPTPTPPASALSSSCRGRGAAPAPLPRAGQLWSQREMDFSLCFYMTRIPREETAAPLGRPPEEPVMLTQIMVYLDQSLTPGWPLEGVGTGGHETRAGLGRAGVASASAPSWWANCVHPADARKGPGHFTAQTVTAVPHAQLSAISQ